MPARKQVNTKTTSAKSEYHRSGGNFITIFVHYLREKSISYCVSQLMGERMGEGRREEGKVKVKRG